MIGEAVLRSAEMLASHQQIEVAYLGLRSSFDSIRKALRWDTPRDLGVSNGGLSDGVYTCKCTQGGRSLHPETRFYLTQCINEIVSESQLPHNIVN